MAEYGGEGGGGSGMSFGSNLPRTSSTSNTQTVKSIAYRTGSDKATQLISISKSASDSSVKTVDPHSVVVENTGSIPVTIACGYENYSSETADSNKVYVHSLVLPGQSINPPVRTVVSTQGSNADHTNADFADQSLYNLDGTVVDFVAPNTNLYTDSTAEVDLATASTIGSDATHTTLNVLSGESKLFRVGDLIRIENEICEVTALGTGADLANSTLTITRGAYGSAAATHADTTAIRFPFFNEYYDFDRALSGSSQLVQTDEIGRFKASNFFGYGRNAGAAPSGLTPGSVLFKFYSSAYQEVMMGGTTSNIPISQSTDSKLSASTAYAFDLTIDDSAATTISFTTDSANVTFNSGTNSVIANLQDAINTATRTAGNGLYGYGCTVNIKNSMLCFTSTSHLLPHDGTNGGKILLADASSGTNLFSGRAGIFPDDALINAPVAPKLPDSLIYDKITYATSPNMGNIAYDDGMGNIFGACRGTINYETGAFNITSAPINASFEVSLAHSGPFSGKINSEEAVRTNSLVDVYANVINKHMTGSVRITTL